MNAIPHEKLYEQVLAWRENGAANNLVMPNMVLSKKTAATIAEKLPATLKALSGIKGMGLHKAGQYCRGTDRPDQGIQQEISGNGADQHSLF